MKLLLPLLAALSLLPPPRLAAQAADAGAMSAVQRLFDGMRAGDSAAVRAAFHPDVVLLTTANREGAPVLQKGSVDAFANAVGAPHEEVWDEQIRNAEVRTDDNLATAWMDYAFYIGDTLSHCGVNAFQLFRGAQGWQIIAVTDTRRREGCEPIPRS